MSKSSLGKIKVRIGVRERKEGDVSVYQKTLTVHNKYGYKNMKTTYMQAVFVIYNDKSNIN